MRPDLVFSERGEGSEGSEGGEGSEEYESMWQRDCAYEPATEYQNHCKRGCIV